jgi:hypothetical protein
MNFPYICSNIPAAHAYREISLSCSDIPKPVDPNRILNLLEALAMISFPKSNGLWATNYTPLCSIQLTMSINFVLSII